MKTVIKYTLFTIFIMGALISCRDEDVIRMPELKNGPNWRMQIDPNNSFFDLGDLNSAKLAFDVYSENFSEIESVDVTMRYQQAGNPSCADRGCTDPIVIKTYSGSAIRNAKGTFKGEAITAQELSQALNLPLSAFLGGDNFFFTVKVTMTDGRVYPNEVNGYTGQTNTPGIFNQAGSSFTTNFNTFVGCFSPEEMVGTWTKVVDSWEVSPDDHSSVEIVLGPGTDQFTVKNIFGFNFDLIASVNPLSGAITVAKQETWLPSYWGMPASYGKGYATAASTNGSVTYSCVGQLNFKFSYTVDAGSFGGIHDYKLVKQ